MAEAVSEFDIRVYFSDELIVGIILDEVQNTHPWYQGTIVDGPVLKRWRAFVEAYHRADLEFDYCPHHPHEGFYDDTDLAGYVSALTALHQARQRTSASQGGDPRLAPWSDSQPEQLESYLRFLDFRRWRAITRAGEIIAEIPLPPDLDLATRRFAFRVG